MEWPYEIAERDHVIQNPTSPEKIRLLGEYLRLGGKCRVLDIACGKGGPAIELASSFGCRILGIELREAFAEEARARVATGGLDRLVEIRTADARELAFDAEGWDAALCLGASFVWGWIGEAAAALVPVVRPGGFVAVGEPFWRRWPLPAGLEDEGYVGLEETVARFEAAGLSVTGIIGASEDDWDRYESLHWRALEEWLADEPVDPRVAEIRGRHERVRTDYFRSRRQLLGWAILVGRKPGE